jgi:hypothetical protein
MAGLTDAIDPRSSSLTGRGPPQPPPPPGMGPRMPGIDERVSTALRPWLGDHISRQIGAVMPFTPMGGAYQGGENLGQAWAEGDPWRGALGAGQVALSALPLGMRAPPPRPTSNLSFAPGDVRLRALNKRYSEPRKAPSRQRK